MTIQQSRPPVLLRLPQVSERVLLKKSAIYQKIKDNDFPAPAKLGGISAWVEEEVDAWVRSHLTARPENRPTVASS